ncbi:MAG: hypothetical protein JO113_05085 [Candidatus Eremiobacteraeota bacterium]|nr:hypothetical protein [Candidatus Eremiobacteraeota bacterium]
MSFDFTKTSIAVFVSLALLRPALAQDTGTEYVLPDKYFVQSECARLASTNANVAALAAAHRAVAQACQAYNSDGDAWFAAVQEPRDDIDGYDPHPELHDYTAVGPSQSVPQKKNASYVLFLAPDIAWVKNNGKDLATLHDAFVNFGDAIGGRGLAIWFTKNEDPASIDVAHSAQYCFTVFQFGTRHGLSINGGPYIVFTSTRPDHWTNANDLVILKLSGLTSGQTIALMNKLEQQILEGKKPNQGGLLFSEMEYRLITLEQQHSSIFHTMVMFIFKGVPALAPSGS